MRDGDIYRWYWKDHDKRNDFGAFKSYHCKSTIAIAKNGQLFDTFWSTGMNHRVEPSEVTLELLGNANDMTIISKWDVKYYRPDDVVDTRHSNDSSAPIYLKAGATRDADAMLEYLRAKRREIESRIGRDTRVLQGLSDDERLIVSGSLEDVVLHG